MGIAFAQHTPGRTKTFTTVELKINFSSVQCGRHSSERKGAVVQRGTPRFGYVECNHIR